MGVNKPGHIGQKLLARGASSMTTHEAPSPSVDNVVRDVQDFYERYPYPAPVSSLDNYQRLWNDPVRRRQDHYMFWPSTPYRDDHSILIAGCGTSQAAKHAMRWPNATVTGIDFSANSALATEELKRKYNLDNLQVHQLSIDRVADLGADFDNVVCTGVLHHLADPGAGLQALRNVLKPDGAMNLMLYAPYGRAGIYMLQEFCRRTGIAATDAGIAELIAALQVLPPAHPLQTLLREAPDFRKPAALADALLHPQDRAYSVTQLFDFLECGGMQFGRWIAQAPYRVQCGQLAHLPHASRIAMLPAKEHYAAAELFRGTMFAHSVVAYRSDRPDCMRQPDFSDESWRDYIPIRMSGTFCVQERLPPGAEAVLINPGHTFRDLVLPINAMEKRLLDEVDGVRSITAIVESIDEAGAEPLALFVVRAFFERLWYWDQMVYDISHVTTTS